MIDVRAGDCLADSSFLPALARAWLSGTLAPGAARAWEDCLGAGGAPAGRVAPAFASADWVSRWRAELLADQPDAAARDWTREMLARLARGEAQVIVTGQQPGFLGGPLLTLFKTATAVAAAAARTAAGRPTAALFWSGDDDDDQAEAFAPLLHDPRRGALLKGIAPGGPADRMVGAAPAGDWAAGEAAWLARQAGRGGLAADLASIWEEARSAGLSWGRLQRRALLRAFGGAGLLAVSGNDAGLHAAASPLYRRLLSEAPELGELARAEGAELAAAGYHAQLGERSLARPFHRAEGGRRLALARLEEVLAADDVATLRPGVLLRAAVQDWLFRPAAAVVGPAELAYLLQLAPVYRRLELARPSLLPRLHATMLPADSAPSPATGTGVGGADAPDRAPAAAAEAAADIAQAAGRRLADWLRRLAALEGDAASRLVARQEKAWRRQAEALLIRASRPAPSAAAGAGRREAVAWLAPRGGRQERIMASWWAGAIWGDALLDALLAAAGRHLAGGAAGDWREYLLLVPPPLAVENGEGKGR